ncbi:MAG: hypothetical protein AAB600_02100 [Patescibacteria group bacterium]
MSKEVLQSTPRKDSVGKRIIPKAIRSAVLAGGFSLALIAASYGSGNVPQAKYENAIVSSVDTLPPTNMQETLTQDIFVASPKPKQEQEIKSKDGVISDVLSNNYARVGLAAALAMAASITINAYQLGKRHDEAKLHMLRVAGPLIMTASASSALIDSFITIDRNIPASLFLASTLLIASHQITNTFQHYKNSKIRASAVFTAAMFVSLGATALIVLNR